MEPGTVENLTQDTNSGNKAPAGLRIRPLVRPRAMAVLLGWSILPAPASPSRMRSLLGRLTLLHTHRLRGLPSLSSERLSQTSLNNKNGCSLGLNWVSTTLFITSPV